MKVEKIADPAPPTPWPDKYGIGGLERDETIFIACDNKERVRSAVHRHGQRNGKSFSCRVVVEGGVSGLRVWRTE